MVIYHVFSHSNGHVLCRLHAVASVSRQLMDEVQQQAQHSSSCLAAVSACLREYHELVVAACDGSQSSPGASPSGSVPQSPIAGGTPSPHLGFPSTSNQQIRILTDHISLRDHIVGNLATIIQKLEKGLVKGSTECSGLARKSSMAF